jgi:PhnB protein
MILTVPDPDATIAKAIAAGAQQVFAVSEEHGWHIGRVIDPFGLHWEIGRPPVKQTKRVIQLPINAETENLTALV